MTIPPKARNDVCNVKLFVSISSGIKCMNTSPKSAPAAKLTRYKIILFSFFAFIARANTPTNDIKLMIMTLPSVYIIASFIFDVCEKSI